MRYAFVVLCVALLVGHSVRASIPIATGPDVVWHGDFDPSGVVLGVNCSYGTDGYCREDMPSPSRQLQITNSLVAEGQYAARFEVAYGDIYQGESDARALLTPTLSGWAPLPNPPPNGPPTGTDELWYRWQVYLPPDYVASWPKEDQLGSSDLTTTARRGGGYNVEWHHDSDPNKDINPPVLGGSAPIYFSTGSVIDPNARTRTDYFTFLLNGNYGNTQVVTSNLMPLVRGQWVDWLVHIKWSLDPSVGFVEAWADSGSGLMNVLPKVFGATTYPNPQTPSVRLQTFWTVGLYRSASIGDPTLHYTSGAQVYPPPAPVTVAYFDGFVIGKTFASVYNQPLYQLDLPVIIKTASGKVVVLSL